MSVWLVLLLSLASGSDPAALVRSGNDLYNKGQFDKAITAYDKAISDRPDLWQAVFNKANAYYRLDDQAKAAELYMQVAAGSKDMDLVKKAKYNLGNTHFQMGLKQRDSDLSKALEQLRASIGCWRAVLDIDPNYEPAKRNKEVAGLIIKDILDQLKRQQQSDPNKPSQGQDKKQPQGSQPSGLGEPNQPNEPNQPSQAIEPNQPDQTDQQGQIDTAEQIPQDTTAQQIIEQEHRQRMERQMLLRGMHTPVDKDW